MTEEMVRAAERLVVEAQAYAAAVRQGAAVDRLLTGQAEDPYGSRAFVDKLWSQELRTRWDGVIGQAYRVNAQFGAHHG